MAGETKQRKQKTLSTTAKTRPLKIRLPVTYCVTEDKLQANVVCLIVAIAEEILILDVTGEN